MPSVAKCMFDRRACCTRWKEDTTILDFRLYRSLSLFSSLPFLDHPSTCDSLTFDYCQAPIASSRRSRIMQQQPWNMHQQQPQQQYSQYSDPYHQQQPYQQYPQGQPAFGTQYGQPPAPPAHQSHGAGQAWQANAPYGQANSQPQIPAYPSYQPHQQQNTQFPGGAAVPPPLPATVGNPINIQPPCTCDLLLKACRSPCADRCTCISLRRCRRCWLSARPSSLSWLSASLPRGHPGGGSLAALRSNPTSTARL